MLRLLGLLLSLLVLMGTSCIHTRSMLVQPVAGLAPADSGATGTTSAAVHALLSRFAVERGFVLDDSARHHDGLAEWCAFHPRHGPWICWRTVDERVAVTVSEQGAGRPSARGDSLRHDIAALLATRFGAEAVRPCRWHVAVDRARSTWWSTKTRAECIAEDDTTTRSRPRGEPS